MAIRQDASTGKITDDGKPADVAATDADKLSVKVYSPFRTYYNDMAKSLTAASQTGTFDILPQHHKFISLLEPCDVQIVTLNGDTRVIKIAGGIIHVRNNRTTIMLDV